MNAPEARRVPWRAGSDQAQLKLILGNAQVVVSFEPSASLRAREAAIPAIISRLQQLTTTTETE
jgi:hypothetical protein